MSSLSAEKLADLMRSKSVAAWCDLIFRFGHELGYEQVRFAILPDPNLPIEAEYAFQHSNYAPAWLDKYTAEKMHHVDPTFAHCVNKSTPLIWQPGVFAGCKQKEMYEEACQYGVISGVTLPIHGPRGELGIVCFATDQRAGGKFQQEAHHSLPELSYLRDLILETSSRFMRPRASEANNFSITPRELECIKWCAAGKSSWDIAQILHCSEATVNFHFSSLRRKFRVSSRQQVLVKAMRHGLFSP